MEFSGRVTNGTLPEAIQQAISQALEDMEGKRVVLKLEEVKPRRSQNQNAYYWSQVIPPITAAFREAGNDVDDQDCHEYLKTHVGKLRRVVVTPAGEIQRIPGSTKRLTKQEMEVYLEKVRAWAAATLGVGILLPNEHLESPPL